LSSCIIIIVISVVVVVVVVVVFVVVVVSVAVVQREQNGEEEYGFHLGSIYTNEPKRERSLPSIVARDHGTKRKTKKDKNFAATDGRGTKLISTIRSRICFLEGRGLFINIYLGQRGSRSISRVLLFKMD
jgi:hypothetical protein